MLRSGRSLRLPGLVAAACLLAAAQAACRGAAPPPKRASERPSILLISLDTLRADRLNAYGYRERVVSPNIDALARDGVLFESHLTTSPWTTPAHLSLLTSLHPTAHGVTQSFRELERQVLEERVFARLPEQRVTLAEVLASAGYATAAFTAGITLDPRLGFDQGFARYDTSMEKLNRRNMSQLDAWIGRHAGRRFFLFWHTFEVHAPYLQTTFLHDVLPAAKARQVERALAERAEEHRKGLAPGRGLLKTLRRQGVLSREVCEALYMGGVRSADAWLGELVAGLKRRGLYDRMLIVLTSDHGEELGDHAPDKIYDAHGHTLYDELLRVPLVVKLPGQAQAGRRVSALTSALDVMPSLLDLLEIPPPADVQGVSLRPLWEGAAAPAPRPAFAEALGEPFEKKAVRAGRHKYILSVDAASVAREGRRHVPPVPSGRELYDLQADPGETANLLRDETRPDNETLAADLDRVLRAHLAGLGGPAAGKVELDPETIERLRGLGYIQ